MQTKEPAIKGIRIGTVEVIYKDKPDPDKLYWGHVKVKCADREFIWDVCQSYTDFGVYTDDLAKGHYCTTLDLEADPDVFGDCPYDLTHDDMLDPESATLYVEGVDPRDITLYFTDLEARDDDEYGRGNYRDIPLIAE